MHIIFPRLLPYLHAYEEDWDKDLLEVLGKKEFRGAILHRSTRAACTASMAWKGMLQEKRVCFRQSSLSICRAHLHDGHRVLCHMIACWRFSTFPVCL